MLPPPTPQCKQAVIKKVAKRSRELLISAVAPTSGDEMDQSTVPPLQPFLRGAPSQSQQPSHQPGELHQVLLLNGQLHSQSQSRELRGAWTGAALCHEPLPHQTTDATYRKKPRRCCDEEFRWSCWSCQLNPHKAKAAGFSPSKRCWAIDAQPLYDWWQARGKQSHWDWVYEAEAFRFTHYELMCFLLGADMREWPLPWTSFALGAIPRELPRKSRRSTASSLLQMHPLNSIGTLQRQSPKPIGLFPPSSCFFISTHRSGVDRSIPSLIHDRRGGENFPPPSL